MNAFETGLIQKLEERSRRNLLRQLTTHSSLIDFSSNDYLGLARSKELEERINSSTKGLRNGATGSRLLSGNSVEAEQLEEKLGKIFYGQALLFNSGYMANLAVLSCLPQRGDTILLDEYAHASMRDGARLSFARTHSFHHNDVNDLEKKLKNAAGKKFIAVESIYSMDGDACPVEEVIQLAEKYEAVIIWDEAHSTGIFGNQGEGLALIKELNIPVRIYTFGKAMGVHGACVVGSEGLKNFLINHARSFIYTTALPPHSVKAISCAFDYLKENNHLQMQLQKCIDYFLQKAKWENKINSQSPVQCVIFGEKVRAKAEHLMKAGLDCRPILSPTVPQGKERIRLCIHAFNTEEEIDLLIQAMG